MAFYHFSLFALRRERIDPLLFGLFCLSIGLRTISRSEGLLLYEISLIRPRQRSGLASSLCLDFPRLNPSRTYRDAVWG
jgi:hypothetical protein